MFFCILKYTSDSLHSSFTSLRRAIFQFCTTTLLRYITHRRLSDLLQWFAMVVHCIIYPTTYVVLHLLCLFLSLTTRTRFTSCLDFWYVRNVSFYVWSHFDKKKKKNILSVFIYLYCLALKCFNTVLCIHMACYYRYMYFIVAIKLTVTAGLMVIFGVKIIIKRVWVYFRLSFCLVTMSLENDDI